jgi:hypothetical protein
MCVPLNRDDSVIADFLFLIALLTLYHSDDAALQNAPGECRFVHQHQNVDGIAVVSFGRRDKAKVVGKCHPSRQYLFQFKDALVCIERKLIPAALGCFDHHPEKLFALGERFQMNRIRQCSGTCLALVLIRSFMLYNKMPGHRPRFV